MESASGEISDRSEDHAVGNWRRGDPCYKVAERARTRKSCGPSPSLTIEGMKVRERDKGTTI